MPDDMTSFFGFKKVQPDGAMVYGKDLNDVLDSIDERLQAALGAMSEMGAADDVAIGSAAWAQVVFDDEKELIFASKMRLTKARAIVLDGTTTIGANTGQIALALASDPSTPITTPVDVTAAGVDVELVFPAVIELEADEELILIERDKAETGFVATAKYQIVVEGNKVL